MSQAEMQTEIPDHHHSAAADARAEAYAVSEEELARRNEMMIALLHEWLADESGYDEKVWPRLKEVIEENRLSRRKRFDDTRHVGYGTARKNRASTRKS